MRIKYSDTHEWAERIVGNSIIAVDDRALTLSNGEEVLFSNTYECCSWVSLTKLTPVNHIITSVRFETEYLAEPGDDERPYVARLFVLTEAGEFNAAEAVGDIGSGYYLNGFALDVQVSS